MQKIETRTYGDLEAKSADLKQHHKWYNASVELSNEAVNCTLV